MIDAVAKPHAGGDDTLMFSFNGPSMLQVLRGNVMVINASQAICLSTVTSL